MNTDFYLTSLLIAALVTIFFGFGIAPSFKEFIYKYKMWRKVSRSNNTLNEDFKKLNNKEETSVPRIGGAIIIITAIFSILILFVLSRFTNLPQVSGLDFLSRSQTLLPLGVFVFAGLVGFVDDALQIWGKGKWIEDPIILRIIKSISIIFIGLFLAYWFYFKLGISSFYLPFYGDVFLGYLFIPFFIIVLYGVFSGSVIDGIDGLSGGVLLSSFGAFAVITYFRNQYDLSALAVIIVSSILVFLWYNIMPAQFYMGETGMLALTTLITIYAFFTNTVILLPILVFPLFITSVSVVVQLIYKKITKGKKILRVAPLHHHFEAIGWTRPQIVMRFWIISFISSILGVILYFVS